MNGGVKIHHTLSQKKIVVHTFDSSNKVYEDENEENAERRRQSYGLSQSIERAIIFCEQTEKIAS